jgi:hypothetical protein
MRHMCCPRFQAGALLKLEHTQKRGTGVLFALFSSMCEQKVSAYMPSWALLVMTAVW